MWVTRNLRLRPLLLKNFCKAITVDRYVHVCHVRQAGHSKWANIKHIKAQKDGEKAATFTKLTRQIRLAIQEGGSSDPTLNASLRNAIDEALRRSMPMATIKSTLQKCQQNKSELKEYQVELRYKQKVFAVCVLYTDNFASLKMELAPIIKKHDAVLFDAAHMFDDFGLIEAKIENDELKEPISLEDRATTDAIECGAEEVEIVDNNTGMVNFICSPGHLNTVSKAIAEKGYKIENSEHMYTAKNFVKLSFDELKGYEALTKKLHDVSGIESIYDNVHPDEISS